jgi:hypothetical protein
MSNLKRKTIYFFMDEEEKLHRIPAAKYQRIFERTQPITLFAGQSIRFIEAYVQEYEAGVQSLIHAWFTLRDFDAQGLWDEEHKEKALEAAVAIIAHMDNPDWREFFNAEPVDPFRWKSTPALIERLRKAIKTKRKHS